MDSGVSYVISESIIYNFTYHTVQQLHTNVDYIVILFISCHCPPLPILILAAQLISLVPLYVCMCVCACVNRPCAVWSMIATASYPEVTLS